MGCASSAPLVEQGKQLVEGVKDTANDTMAKGERAINDTTDTIKEGLDSVKGTVQSALNTAEESVGSVAHKIGDTFNSFSNSKPMEKEVDQLNDHLNSMKEDLSAPEAISEAETVVMSEIDHAREAFQSGTSPFFDTVGSLDEDVASSVAHLKSVVTHQAHDLEDRMETKTDGILEDLEDTKNFLGEAVDSQVKKLMPEELHEESEKGIIDGDHVRLDKEEAPPTFWEAAADAIVMTKTIKNLEPHGHHHQEWILVPNRAEFSDCCLQTNDAVD